MFNNNYNSQTEVQPSSAQSFDVPSKSKDYDLPTTERKVAAAQQDVLSCIDTMVRYSENNPEKAPLSAETVLAYKDLFVKATHDVSLAAEPEGGPAHGAVLAN